MTGLESGMKLIDCHLEFPVSGNGYHCNLFYHILDYQINTPTLFLSDILISQRVNRAIFMSQDSELQDAIHI